MVATSRRSIKARSAVLVRGLVLWSLSGTGMALLVPGGVLAAAPSSQTAPPVSEDESALPTPDDAIDAVGYRTLGDRHTEEGRSDLAAEAYQRALELDRGAFSLDDRTAMAIRISWADMLDEAVRELESVLAEDPDHLGARIHLARVHSWSDDLGAAILAADDILADFPDNPDALVIKADSLEWQGRSQSAITFYRRSISGNATFDARVGLAYALLSTGDRMGALAQAESAFATIPSQQERLSELVESIDETRAPRINVGHSYFKDSDDNRVHRTTLNSSFGMGNFDFSSSLSRIETTGSAGTRRTENVSIGVDRSIGERFGIGGGIHLTRFEGEGSFGRPSGRLEFSVRAFDGEFGFRLTRDLLVDTVGLVEDRTAATRAGVHASIPIGRRATLAAEYGRRRMSDRNGAHDIGAGLSYDVAGFAGVGYRMRFSDYDRSSGTYFAPNTYVSHRAFASIGTEWDRFYVFAEVYLGPQRFERNGVTTSEFGVGGWLSIGFRPASFVTIELSGESGDLAAGSVSGYKYFSLGPNISFSF